MAWRRSSGGTARCSRSPCDRRPVVGPRTFAELGPPAELPVTDELSSRLLSVPFHSRLSRDELTEIADSLSRAVAAR